MTRELRQIVGAERIKQISVSAEEPRHGHREFRCHAPDHTIEFGATAIVRRVADDLDGGSFVPPAEPKATSADWRRRRLSKSRHLDFFQLMRRKYQQLCGCVQAAILAVLVATDTIGIELLLGLRPMTVYDASATPMTRAFNADPKADVYPALIPSQPLDQRNPVATALAARSARLDFDDADKIDDNELNQILWLAIKGTPPPTPTRSLFGGK